MNLADHIKTGMTREESYPVEESNSARHIGSGDSGVLATPWMIAFIERTCHKLIAADLPAGFSSVGTVVNVHHLAPTPVGQSVTVIADVLAVEGWKVSFQVRVLDEQEIVGEGQHERFVIDEARFLKRVAEKKSGRG